MPLREKEHKAGVAAARINLLKVRLPASTTLEAAILTPIFIFSILSIISIIFMIGVEMEIRESIISAVRQSETLPYLMNIRGNSPEAVNIVTRAKIRAAVNRTVSARNSLKGKIIGGSSGILIKNLRVVEDNAEIKVKTAYSLKLPVNIITGKGLKVSQEIYSYAWTGDEKINKNKKDEKMVYITPAGTVYHKDRNCSYLQPKLMQLKKDEVRSKRNYNGEIYRACESCSKKTVPGSHIVYISKYGDRYHTNGKCKKISHEIIAIPFSHVGGRCLCSKEVGKND